MRARLLLLAALSACANLPEGRHVESAGLIGAEAVDADDVLDGLQNHAPDGIIFVDYAEYEPLALDVDRKRIESFYAQRGYFSARVTAVDVDEHEDSVVVRFTVDEGRPSLLDEVSLHGAPEDLEARLEAEARALPVGQPFVYARYDRTKALLRHRLVSAGHAFAKVDGRVKVDREGHRVHVRFDLDPGPRVRVRAIEVEGLEDLPREFVDIRMILEPGDVLVPEALDESRARILATGLVEAVRFRWDRDTRAEEVDLVVSVSRGPRNELRLSLGGGRSQNLQARAQAGYVRRSLFDPRLTLAVEVRPSYELIPDAPDGPSIEATAELSRHDFLFDRVVGTAAVSYGFIQREAYHTNGPSTAVGFSRPFVDDRLRVGARVEYQHLDLGVDDLLEPLLGTPVTAGVGIVDPLRVLFFAPYVTLEGRDNPVNPRSGYVADFRFEIGGALGGGLGSYVKVVPELKGYVTIAPRLVGVARVRFGTTLSGGPLPVTRRFFAGGPESQRGFGWRRLAPRLDGAPKLPVGAESLLEANVEIRLDIVQILDQWLGVVAFVDGADATLDLDQLDPARLHWAAGGGLRYRTPVGPVRLDFGYRLNRRNTFQRERNGDRPWAIHFSLGEAF